MTIQVLNELFAQLAISQGHLAVLSIPADVVKAAQQEGLFVLKRSNNVCATAAKGMQVF